MSQEEKYHHQKQQLLLAEEAQEVERDILEHEIQPDDVESKGLKSTEMIVPTERDLEEKGYDLQQAYKYIGGLGKSVLALSSITKPHYSTIANRHFLRSLSLVLECNADNGFHVWVFPWTANAVFGTDASI